MKLNTVVCKTKMRGWMWLLWTESWWGRPNNPRKCWGRSCCVPTLAYLSHLYGSLLPHIWAGEKQDPQNGWQKERRREQTELGVGLKMISSASATWNKGVLDASWDCAFCIYLEKQTNCSTKDLALALTRASCIAHL